RAVGNGCRIGASASPVPPRATPANCPASQLALVRIGSGCAPMCRQSPAIAGAMVIARCPWVNADDSLMRDYHDREWGVPTHDDPRLFESLIREAAQAGPSWSIVLKKREGYRRAFSQFDPEKVARYSPARIDKLTADPGIIRNRMKIAAAVKNARAFLAVQR